MTPEFAATMQATLEELVAGKKFHRRRDSTLVEPTVARTNPPPLKPDYAEGDNFPLVRWALYRGRVAERIAEFEVVITLGVWTPGGHAEGTDDIERLLGAVLDIGKQRVIAGHRLDPEIEFVLGEQQEEHAEGLQPHPFYQAQIKLKFSAPIRRNHCNQ